MAIVFYTISINALLLYFERSAMPQETIQTISVFGGITSAAATVVYGVLTGFRDHSKNKHGITKAEMTRKDVDDDRLENKIEQ